MYHTHNKLDKSHKKPGISTTLDLNLNTWFENGRTNQAYLPGKYW